MQKTTYKIARMDCPTEENLIRLKLEGNKNIKALQFNLSERQLEIIHLGKADPITSAIQSLNSSSSVLKTADVDESEELLFSDSSGLERKLLWQVLYINFFFFLLELITGYFSKSIGLIADSLDMLADAVVYGMALFAVTEALAKKVKIARLSGYLQLILALFGFIEVIRRFIGYDETPNFKTMIGISFFALLGNAITLYLLQRSKNKEAHMQAYLIFTSTDVIINVGVIIAGALVYFTHSNLPDLIVGTIVFVLVGIGSYRILKL